MELRNKKRELLTTTYSVPGTNRSVSLTQALRRGNKRTRAVPAPFAHMRPGPALFLHREQGRGRSEAGSAHEF